jgi:hypothetical protein
MNSREQNGIKYLKYSPFVNAILFDKAAKFIFVPTQFSWIYHSVWLNVFLSTCFTSILSPSCLFSHYPSELYPPQLFGLQSHLSLIIPPFTFCA